MKADDPTLARLMAAAQRGDRAAYATLLGEARRWLTRYFARRVPGHVLDDLVQDTLMSLHAKRASYDPARPFLPWLAAIARYRWIDQLRRVYRADETSLDHDIAGAGDEEAVAARISLDRLFEFLPAAQVTVIRMVKIEGRSVAEAADASGQSESLVKVNIHRGLKKLAAMIERE